jgi:hypothetical protein
MKHIKLFEEFTSKLNEGFYSSSDIKKLKDFAAEVSEEIIDANDHNKKFDEDEFSAEEMFNYISGWGEDNDMKAADVIKEFDWRSLTSELGL